MSKAREMCAGKRQMLYVIIIKCLFKWGAKRFAEPGGKRKNKKKPEHCKYCESGRGEILMEGEIRTLSRYIESSSA